MSGADRHVLDQLSEYLDGDLRDSAVANVRAHLGTCSACARAAAEMRAIVNAAQAIDPAEPPPTLWPAIEGALARPERGAGILGWRTFVFGTFAGAAVALAIVWVSSRPGAQPSATLTATDTAAPAGTTVPLDPLLEEAEAEFARAAAAYERSIEKLRTLLAREEPRWSPEDRARYADRLVGLDEVITRSREVARRRPADSAGNELLFAAYQKKIEFLAAAVHRGAPGPGGGGR